MGGSNFAIWVHFVVHSFTVIKHLLPHESPLFNPIFPDAPEPFNHLPIAKFVLGLMKLYGAYVCFEAGLNSIAHAQKDVKRYKTLLGVLDKVMLRNATKKVDGKRPYTLEPVIMRQGIVHAKHTAEGSYISGLGGIAVAIFFFISALNYLKVLKFLSIHPSIQFHYPEITVHALILLEISLMYMLKPIYEHTMNYYDNAMRGFRLSEKVAELEKEKAEAQKKAAAAAAAAASVAAAKGKKKKSKGDDAEEEADGDDEQQSQGVAKLNAVEFILAASEVGFNSTAMMDMLKLSQKYPLKLVSMTGNYPHSDKPKNEMMEEFMEKDLDYLQKILGFVPITTGSKASAVALKDDDEDGPWRDVGGDAASGQRDYTTDNSCAGADIRLKSEKSLVHANIDFGVFALNATAIFFYVFILTGHYFPYDKLNLDPSSLDLLRMLHFGLSSSEAMWYGEFLGDVALTIEPALDLLAPTIMSMMFAHSHSHSAPAHAKDEKAGDKKKHD